MEFFTNYWEIILEVGLLWMAYYLVFLLLKGTIAEQVLKGLIVVTVIVAITKSLDLVIINWLLTRLLAISVIAFIVIFQPEIRRGLARIGRFGAYSEETTEVLGEISKAATVLAKKKVGGLIAMEREVGLRRYVESGVTVDSAVTSELINTIFTPNTPLHDGGVIVSQQRIEAAACLFPLTQNPNVPKTMGTRHRAALGLSEETDAVIVVVSEQTGEISIAVSGRMTKDIDPKSLSKIIEKTYIPNVKKSSFASLFIRRVAKRGEGA
jgi:diadenylate cyclase